MVGLMLAALCDTVIAPVPQFDVVRVHEWGVVWFGHDRIVATADPASTWDLYSGPYTPDEPICAEAPVVYFHGPDFTGSLRVEAVTGDFTVSYPTPSAVTPDALVWRFSAASSEQQHPAEELVAERMLPRWPVESWREVPANWLVLDDGSRERFVYYETEIPASEFPHARRIVEEQRVDQGMLIRPGPDGLEHMPVAARDVWTAKLSWEFEELTRERAVSTLCSWAGGQLKTPEIEALWDSWSGHLSSGSMQGDAVLLFPVPADQVWLITSLSMEIDGDLRPEFHRFFVGMVGVSRE